jgi:hypothetical protein
VSGPELSGPRPRHLELLVVPLIVALAAALPGGRWWLPVVVALPLLPGFVAGVRARAWWPTWRLAMAWAALLSASIVALVVVAPERAAAAVLNAEPYRQLMFGWIFEGVGPELEPSRFLPEHALHLGAFVVLALLSGGVLGLMLGAALVGYMSYFVGSYAVASGHLVLGTVAAWVPWSVFRVAAFVMLGCLLARPLLVRRFDFGRAEWRLVGLAAAGIACDLVLKTFGAAPYGRFLAWLAGS